MSIIITDNGAAPVTEAQVFVPHSEWQGEEALGVDLPSDIAPELLTGVISAPAIRIAFPTFSDGRGFTLAARLRRLGYKGHLRAYGHVLPDQYRMARRSGFDDVEISRSLADRVIWPDWQPQTDWQSNDYRARLRKTA